MEENYALIVNAIVAIVSVFLGGCLALFGNIISNKNSQKLLSEQLSHSTKVEKERLFRESGVELYVLFSKWSTLVMSSELSVLPALRSEISYNDFLDIHIDTMKTLQTDQHTLELLIRLYYPSINTEFRNLRSIMEVFGGIRGDFRNLYKCNKDFSFLIEPFSQTASLFERKSEEIKKMMVSEIKKNGGFFD